MAPLGLAAIVGGGRANAANHVGGRGAGREDGRVEVAGKAGRVADGRVLHGVRITTRSGRCSCSFFLLLSVWREAGLSQENGLIYMMEVN